MTTRDWIDDFFRQRRLALVGVSRKDTEISRTLFREFRRRGYDAVPVNPGAEELDGVKCFHRVQEISPPVEGALLFTPPKVTEAVVMDCAAAGVPRIWIYGAGGQGGASKAAIGYCRSKGIPVVVGLCPYMFWKDAAFFHRLHGFFVKLARGLSL